MPKARDIIRYARLRLFYRLLRRVQVRTRRKRMRMLQSMLDVRRGLAVLDMGGEPDTWDCPSLPTLRVTLLNLPGAINRSAAGRHRWQYVEDDGCNVDYLADGSYDLVFSNSVIEHVGGSSRQLQFANQIRRLGRSYWVQTPSVWFPLEAHTGMPFWWLYPAWLKKWFLRSWRRKLPAWTDMIEGTAVLSKRTLRRLFPDGTILVERVLGLPKSYIVVGPKI